MKRKGRLPEAESTLSLNDVQNFPAQEVRFFCKKNLKNLFLEKGGDKDGKK